MSGHVARLVAIYCEAAGDSESEVPSSGVRWSGGCGPGRKRIRLNRKTPAHLAGLVIQSRPHVWKRLRHVGHPRVSIPDYGRRCVDQGTEGLVPAQIRTWVG